MCALFSYFHWLTMVAILQLKASKHFVYFVSIAVVTFTLLNIYMLYGTGYMQNVVIALFCDSALFCASHVQKCDPCMIRIRYGRCLDYS